MALSDLLQEAVLPKTAATYRCGFRSLSHFCDNIGLCALPVDAVTMCAWMASLGPTVKPKSLMKYICGVRFVHLQSGLEWSLTRHPLVLMCLSALRKRYPSQNILQKVPLSLGILLAMCRRMPGWPILSSLLFADLLWATASSVAFFAALRGGEFFTYKGSDRPILLGSMVRLLGGLSSAFVLIDIPSPKTRPDLVSMPAFAVPPSGFFEMSPTTLLRAYRLRASSMSLAVLGSNPAFRLENGTPLSRDFMVSNASRLAGQAGIKVLDSSGTSVPIVAASWRAGFVQSARDAQLPARTIQEIGRWTSAAGPLPYSVSSTSTFRRAADLMLQLPPGCAGGGGQFVSSSIITGAGNEGGEIGPRLR